MIYFYFRTNSTIILYGIMIGNFVREQLFDCNLWLSRDIINPICVAGGDANVVEAPCEPRWSPQGGSRSVCE